MGKVWVWAFVGLLAIIGAVLTIGGVALVLKGGSIYYVLAGFAVLASAFGLMRRAKFGAYAYAGLLIVTIAWSIWEAGFDGWALTPRLAGPALLGLLFLTPPIARAAAVKWWWVGGPALAALFVLGVGFVRIQTAESGLPGAAQVAVDANASTEWRHWGNNLAGTKYTPSAQINTSNVQDLELAWRYDADLPEYGPLMSMQLTPLAVRGRLHLCLESGTVVALNQDTGVEEWRFRGLPENSPHAGWKCRGLGYFEAAATQSAPQDCAYRVLLTTPGELIAIDADTGRRCSTFANNGAADLTAGMGEMETQAAMPTSPPTIINGVIVVGQSISDMGSVESPSGVIRGYDAMTGALRWAWDVGRPGQTMLREGETYTRDTPNAWGVFSGDEALGLVFIGTGNAPPDYFAGQRSEYTDAYTDVLVALDAATGAERWVFRTMNHDMWDYDLSAQPVAVDLADGTPALIVTGKRGEIFMLDRRSGQSLDPIEERAVAQGAVAGDWTAPTQPYTTGFPSVAGANLRETDMWGLTPLDQMACRLSFRSARYEGQFTPLSTAPTLVYPGAAGGVNWGSASVDPQRRLLAVNSLHLAQLMQLHPQPENGVVRGGFEGGRIQFPQQGTPYYATQIPFLGPTFAPCQQPPYGMISVFDIETRRLLWSHPLGTAEGSGPLGIASGIPLRMGAPNLGGSLSTAGGLVFIGAAQDRRLRAYDIGNGRELWSTRLPAIGAANPISYVAPSGRQFVVIAAGGHFAIPGPRARAIMAYALPETTGQR